MQITCPHCEELNQINLDKKINCSSCNKEVISYREGQFNFSGITLTTALLIAVGGGYVFNEYVEEKRYPIDTEYALIESCTSSDRASLSEEQFLQKRELCICALEKTEDNLKHEVIKENMEEFISEYKNNIEICGGKSLADF